MRSLIGTSNCDSIFDENGIPVRQASLDGSIQNIIPLSLSQSIVYLAQQSKLAGHLVSVLRMIPFDETFTGQTRPVTFTIRFDLS